jgi:predicted RecA/RadA family phage recombinase
MKNYVTAGENLTIPAPADTLSGEGVLIGGLFGVATGDALSGAPVTLVRRGVFELPKTSAQAWSVGEILYWDAVGELVTSVAAGNTMIGLAAQAAADPTETGLVLLPGSVAIATA